MKIFILNIIQDKLFENFTKKSLNKAHLTESIQGFKSSNNCI